jgi:hypothetical protein
MKNVLKFLLLPFILLSCQEEEKAPLNTDFNSRQSAYKHFNDFVTGKTYLPVYSHIYHIHEHRTFDLTITASIRNTSMTDTIHIINADYYNTQGENIRAYVKEPIFIKPMETIEIVIGERDLEGGSGANFIVDWAIKNSKNPPLIEAVMISTNGQQGLSYTTRGVEVYE